MATPGLKDCDREPPLRPFLPRCFLPSRLERLAWPCPALLCRRARYDRLPNRPIWLLMRPVFSTLARE
jgi:hypothetical protein